MTDYFFIIFNNILNMKNFSQNQGYFLTENFGYQERFIWKFLPRANV